jgi:hypothetical protein
MPFRPPHLLRQDWGPGLRPAGEADGVRLRLHWPHPRRAALRRRLLAILLAVATVAGIRAAGSRARQAAAQPVPTAPAAQPEGLAASQVELAEGIQAFAAGRELDATELLAAAVAADPQNGTALHWLGLAQLRLGRATAAVGSLTAALAAREPPEAGRQRVTADLRTARLAAGSGPPLTAPGPSQPPAPPATPTGAASPPALEEPPFLGPPAAGTPLVCTGPPPRWDGRLSLEASYDSNPGLLPADTTLLPFKGTRPTGTATDGGFDLDLRLEAHPFYDRGGWSLGLGVTGNRSAYRNQGDLDLALAGGFVQLAWGNDPRGYLTGPLGYTRVPAADGGRLGLLLQAAGSWLGLGAADFLRLAGGAAALTVNGPGPAATRIDGAASSLRFAGDGAGDLRLSGSELSAGLGESLFLGGRGGYLRAVASGGERRAGASFANHFVEVTAEAGAPLPASWTIYLVASRRQERFDDPRSNLTQTTGPARNDVSWRGSIAAVRMLGDHFAVTARGSYVRRDSNVHLLGFTPVFGYRRSVAGMGVSWFF